MYQLLNVTKLLNAETHIMKIIIKISCGSIDEGDVAGSLAKHITSNGRQAKGPTD
jgi:hypothetical protein